MVEMMCVRFRMHLIFRLDFVAPDAPETENCRFRMTITTTNPLPLLDVTVNVIFTVFGVCDINDKYEGTSESTKKSKKKIVKIRKTRIKTGTEN